jgi:hypothetical protein
VSPRLGIQFGLSGLDLELRDPLGGLFVSPGEALARAEQAQQRAEQERQRADQAQQRAELLAHKLRELGGDPEGMD